MIGKEHHDRARPAHQTPRSHHGLEQPTSGTPTVNGRSDRGYDSPVHETGVLLEAKATHSTGAIRTTFTMVPQRLPVLAAKTVVVAAVTFVMLISTLAVSYIGQAIIGTGTIRTATIGGAGVLRAVTGTAGYLAGTAVLGLAIGTLLRSTASSISTVVALLFLLPGLGQLFCRPAGAHMC